MSGEETELPAAFQDMQPVVNHERVMTWSQSFCKSLYEI